MSGATLVVLLQFVILAYFRILSLSAQEKQCLFYLVVMLVYYKVAQRSLPLVGVLCLVLFSLQNNILVF